MNARIFTLIALFATAHAAPAQAPAPVGGILTLLLQPPFVAQVSRVSIRPDGFELALCSSDGTVRTFKSTGSGELEQKLVAHLKRGRLYAFPQCILDLFGLDHTLAIIRSPLPLPAFMPPFAPAQRGLFDVASHHPFRAVVLDQRLGGDHYSIVLQAADTGLHHLSGPYGTERIRRIARRLKRGESFEFPAVLDDALLTDSEREAKSEPKTPETRVLGRYIGEWRGTLEADRKARIRMNCHWKADGSGIWREVTADRDGSPDPPTIDIALVAYDAGQKLYFAANPAPGSPPPLQSTWNESNRTFTTSLPIQEKDRIRVNTATFIADDRIDWITTTRDAGGKTLSATRGSYIRISRTVPPRKLPPPGTAPTITGPALRGTTAFSSESINKSPESANRPFSWFFPPGNPPVVDTDFLLLRDEPPFRGRITEITVDVQGITVLVDGGDHRQYAVRHPRNEDWEKALALTDRLRKGATYEFPDVLADDYKPLPAGFEPRPATEAMRSLEPFLGEWEMELTSKPEYNAKPAGKTTVRYFWKADGTGLWRESHSPEVEIELPGRKQKIPPRDTCDLVTHDPSTQHYVETATPQFGKIKASWDTKTRTYSWNATSDRPEPNSRYSGTRRFVSSDRIEWQNKSTKADGTLIRENSGYYQRIKP